MVLWQGNDLGQMYWSRSSWIRTCNTYIPQLSTNDFNCFLTFCKVDPIFKPLTENIQFMDIFLLVKEMDRLIDRTATCLHIILKCFYAITNHSCSRYRTPNTYKDLVFVNEQIMVREGVIRFFIDSCMYCWRYRENNKIGISPTTKVLLQCR